MRNYDFGAALAAHDLALQPVSIETLWLNITRRCNQSCLHCHVDASPERAEEMDIDTIEQCLKILADAGSCKTLDITGGAPELHPHFEYLVGRACDMGKHVVVRHNLTVTLDGDLRLAKPKTDLPSFFGANRVELLASLPHYEKHVTDGIRGAGVFDKSIEALRRLNDCGYGETGSGLELNLVCNRDGPVSARDRAILETTFRQELHDRYGVVFNRLLAVTNVPINRYLLRLRRSDAFAGYMDGLVGSFDPASTSNLVCRHLISVGYDGALYDCDFNQMVGMTVQAGKPMTIFNFDQHKLLARRIRFGPHCFACTAGCGSN